MTLPNVAACFKLVAAHVMILLSLSELSVDTLVSDVHRGVSGRGFRCLQTLKKRSVAGGSSNPRVKERIVWRFVSSVFGISVDFSDEKCCIGSAVRRDKWRWQKLFWENVKPFLLQYCWSGYAINANISLQVLTSASAQNVRWHIFEMRRTGKRCKAYSLKQGSGSFLVERAKKVHFFKKCVSMRAMQYFFFYSIQLNVWTFKRVQEFQRILDTPQLLLSTVCCYHISPKNFLFPETKYFSIYLQRKPKKQLKYI